MKTKNAPKDLKCKINHTFFWKRGFPKGGRGYDTREKFPKNPVFFFGASLIHSEEMANNTVLPKIQYTGRHWIEKSSFLI